MTPRKSKKTTAAIPDKSERDATAKTRKRKTDINKKTKTKMPADDLEYFRNRLLVLRRELLGDVDNMTGTTLKHNSTNDSGELSAMPVHMADVGTDNYEQEFTLGLIATEREMLKDIDHALGKFKDLTYGICEGTGEPINRPRLEAKPYARYCIDFARKIEQGLVKPKSFEGNQE